MYIYIPIEFVSQIVSTLAEMTAFYSNLLANNKYT